MVKTPIDLKLIEAACGGDTEAIEQMLIQYQPTVTNFARKYCATPEDVEDAVQETLWIASRKIGSLRVASAFFSWLFRVVRHQCYRLLRVQRRETDIDDATEQESLSDNPERYLALQQDVVIAIAHLPFQQRQVLIMRDIEGQSTAEVAEALAISIETVKSRLHRARAELRHRLQHWNESGSKC